MMNPLVKPAWKSLNLVGFTFEQLSLNPVGFTFELGCNMLLSISLFHMMMIDYFLGLLYIMLY